MPAWAGTNTAVGSCLNIVAGTMTGDVLLIQGVLSETQRQDLQQTANRIETYGYDPEDSVDRLVRQQKKALKDLEELIGQLMRGEITEEEY